MHESYDGMVLISGYARRLNSVACSHVNIRELANVYRTRCAGCARDIETWVCNRLVKKNKFGHWEVDLDQKIFQDRPLRYAFHEACAW